MAKQEDYGWDVKYDKARNRVTAIKEHPKGKPFGDTARLVVHSTGGPDTPREIVELEARYEMMAEEIRVSTADDRKLWEERRDTVNREIVTGKVQRALAQGAPLDYAVQRLQAVGVPASEMGAILASAKKEG